MKSVLTCGLILTSLSLVASAVCSATAPVSPPYNVNAFPLMPRLSATGLAGTETLGFGDAMIPLLGSREGDLYADLQGKFGNDQAWMGSAGLGYRQVMSCSNILGAYLFVDQNKTRDKNNFTVLSPGIESLGTSWDFRANGYIPVSSKKVFDHSAFGDELGISQFVFFNGHQQFDRLFNFYEEIGLGADAEIGKIFCDFHCLALYGGGYYFNLQDTSNVRGGELRAELPITSYATLLVNDTYDNHERNTIEAGVRVSLGGLACPTTSYDVHNRLLDPITRNIGALSTGAGIPSFKVRDEGRTTLERDNIWFFTQGNGSIFNPAAGYANCTYEHPCGPNQFNQANINTIDTIAKNANLYFNPGTYPLTPPPANHAVNGRLSLNNGQNMWGRTADYRMAAQGVERPIFTGGLDLLGNNLVDSIQLQNDGSVAAPDAAIAINNTGNIRLHNDRIGTQNNVDNYTLAMTLNNAQNVIIDNSEVNAFTNDPLIPWAQGIIATNSSLNIINHSAINTTADIFAANPPNVSSIGIDARGSSVTVDRSQVNTLTRVTSPNTINFSQAIGINALQGSVLKIKNSCVNTEDSQAGSNTLGPIGSGIVVDNSSLDIDKSLIAMLATAKAQGDIRIQQLVGIQANASKVNIDNSKINVVATANGGVTSGNTVLIAAVEGLSAASTSLNIRHSTVNVQATASATGLGSSALLGSVFGVLVSGASPTTIKDSQINMELKSRAGNATAQADALGLNLASTLPVLIDHCVLNVQGDAQATGAASSASSNLEGMSIRLGSMVDITHDKIIINGTTNAIGGASSVASIQGIVANSATVNISGSQLTANATASGGNSTVAQVQGGIDALNSTVNISNSQFNVNATASGANSMAVSQGIVANGGTFDTADSHWVSNATANGANSAADSQGIFAMGTGIDISKSSFIANATASGVGSTANAEAINSSFGPLNISDSLLAANAAADVTASAAGLRATSSLVTVTDSLFEIFANSNTGDATAIGIDAFGPGTAVIADDNWLNIFAHSDQGNATAFAFQATGPGSVINASNNSGIIAAFAPNGTATAASQSVFGGGVVNETNNNFLVITDLPYTIDLTKTAYRFA